jgi:hypothetical protein
MCPRRAAEISDATSYSISSRYNPAINQYQFRCGGSTIPQKPVILYNPTSGCGYAEGFAEIQKSFHGLHRPDLCSGILATQFNATDILTANIDSTVPSGTSSGAATAVGANSYKAAFAIGQEFESFANRSDLLICGMNTLSSQLFWEANLGLKSDYSQVSLTSTVLDFYAQYDQILVIENGIMSARF